MAASSDETLNIMVVGECGDGKSTLINALRDPGRSEAALCGKHPQGVTKSIVMYPCHAINGVRFNILDTPGVGDHDVTAASLISMIDEFLEAGKVPGGVRGVVVTTPVPDGRIRLGAQIVQMIVDKGFIAPAGADKYGNVILCGTKMDKADAEEKQNFEAGLNGQPSVKELFFQKSVDKTGPCVMVSHTDYSPLLEAIKHLPATTIAYQKLPSKKMAAAMAEKLGMKRQDAASELMAMRKLVKEGAKEVRKVMRKMQAQEMRFRKDMARKEKTIRLLKIQSCGLKQRFNREFACSESEEDLSELESHSDTDDVLRSIGHSEEEEEDFSGVEDLLIEDDGFSEQEDSCEESEEEHFGERESEGSDEQEGFSEEEGGLSDLEGLSNEEDFSDEGDFSIKEGFSEEEACSEGEGSSSCWSHAWS